MSDRYVMESAGEARRLVRQAHADNAQQRLIDAGLAAGMAALDAGCGPGVITAQMAELVGASGRVVAFDASADRIDEARRATAKYPNVSCQVAQIDQTGLPPAGFDFVWSQFVFEYLRDPAAALRELLRVTRPGGTVAVCDLDGLGTSNWPESASIREGTQRFLGAAEKAGVDIFVGRKLFSLFRQQGLRDVGARVYPFYVVAGAADERLLQDWRLRFQTLKPIVAPAFGSSERYEAFCSEYLALLQDENALKYTMSIVTTGTRI